VGLEIVGQGSLTVASPISTSWSLLESAAALAAARTVGMPSLTGQSITPLLVASRTRAVSEVATMLLSSSMIQGSAALSASQ